MNVDTCAEKQLFSIEELNEKKENECYFSILFDQRLVAINIKAKRYSNSGEDTDKK